MNNKLKRFKKKNYSQVWKKPEIKQRREIEEKTNKKKLENFWVSKKSRR